VSRAFTKLFSSITESTVWCEPLATRIVWITMLAMADRQGRVFASIPGLANRARVEVEEAEQAILRFLEPDRYSRTPDHEGRRIEPIDGGWRLLNYAKYREMRDEEARREYQREWDQTRRRRPTQSDKSDKIRPQPTQAEAEAEAEAERLSPVPNGTGVSPAAPTTSPAAKIPACPHEQIVELYHELLPTCPRIREWNETRRGYLRARWREKSKRNGTSQGYDTLERGLVWWRKFFAYVAESRFLTGGAGGHGDRPPFVADLEWLVRPNNFAKVIEGKYHPEARA